MVIGFFSSQEKAGKALEDLLAAGFKASEFEAQWGFDRDQLTKKMTKRGLPANVADECALRLRSGGALVIVEGNGKKVDEILQSYEANDKLVVDGNTAES